MAAARQRGLMRLEQVRYAVAEHDGKTSIIPGRCGMSTTTGEITTDMPVRMGRIPWSRFHLLVVIALGITWILRGVGGKWMMKRLQMSCIATCMMIMAASVEAAGQWSQAQLVTVLMFDNQFQPDHLTFRAHQPYQLRLENHGKQLHEFTAPAFLRSSTVRDKKLLSNGGTDIVVQPGQSVNVFLYPPGIGEYVLTCADHDWDGMVGEIVVK